MSTISTNNLSELNQRRVHDVRQSQSADKPETSKPKQLPLDRMIAKLSINPYFVYPFTVFLFIACQLAISYLFTGTWHYGLIRPDASNRVFTTSELARYDGTNPSRPIYLSILNDVFDVTEGRQFYGPEGGYHIFAGRDGSRAFITGCFNEKGAIGDLRGLPESKIDSLKKWRDFYHDHETYKYVGKLLSEPIDENTPLPDDEDCK